MDFVYVMVGDFVYHLGFVGKSLYFGVFEFVEVFVCDILVYMVSFIFGVCFAV